MNLLCTLRNANHSPTQAHSLFTTYASSSSKSKRETQPQSSTLVPPDLYISRHSVFDTPRKCHGQCAQLMAHGRGRSGTSWVIDAVGDVIGRDDRRGHLHFHQPTVSVYSLSECTLPCVYLTDVQTRWGLLVHSQFPGVITPKLSVKERHRRVGTSVVQLEVNIVLARAAAEGELPCLSQRYT